jgi:hypothetical protein
MPPETGKPKVTPFQAHMARAALFWTHAHLAAVSGIDRRRLHRFENGVTIKDSEAVAATLRMLFESAGIKFREDGISYPAQWTDEDPNASDAENFSQ